MKKKFLEHQTLGRWVVRHINPATQCIVLKIGGFQQTCPEGIISTTILIFRSLHIRANSWTDSWLINWSKLRDLYSSCIPIKRFVKNCLCPFSSYPFDEFSFGLTVNILGKSNIGLLGAVMYPRKHITHMDLESLSHNLLASHTAIRRRMLLPCGAVFNQYIPLAVPWKNSRQIEQFACKLISPS